MDLEALSSQSTANRCVRSIIKYWHSQGYKGIKCRVDDGTGIFSIISNIGPNGYPPRT